MYFGTYYMEDVWLLFALLGVMLLGLFAQSRVQSTFKKYSGVNSYSRIPASRMAAELLQKNNSLATVISVSGSLTDHYNPRENTVGLSQEVYSSSSVAALAVAAHEIGHVMQYESGYVPIRIRNAILPVARIGSQAAPFLVIIGLLFASPTLAMVGVVLFGAAFLFQLLTLPVEFNASRRAIRMLESGNYITYDESDGAKKVLRAAAFTYVVAALASLVTLLRLFLIAGRSRRN